MSSRKYRNLRLPPVGRHDRRPQVATTRIPTEIPEGTSPEIADSIRRRKMLADQEKVLNATLAELGVSNFKAHPDVAAVLTSAGITAAELAEWRKPSPSQLLSRTPEWREAHQAGMNPPKDPGERERLRLLQQQRRQDRRYRVEARRRARLRDATIEPVSRSAIIERDNRTCHLCGKTNLPDTQIHLDHVIPLSRGGPHTEDNLRVACAPCNIRKGARLPPTDPVATVSGARSEQRTNE